MLVGTPRTPRPGNPTPSERSSTMSDSHSETPLPKDPEGTSVEPLEEVTTGESTVEAEAGSDTVVPQAADSLTEADGSEAAEVVASEVVSAEEVEPEPESETAVVAAVESEEATASLDSESPAVVADGASSDEPVAVSSDEPVAVSSDEPVAVSSDEPVAVSSDEPVTVSSDEPVAVVSEEPSAETESETADEPTKNDEALAVAEEAENAETATGDPGSEGEPKAAASKKSKKPKKPRKPKKAKTAKDASSEGGKKTETPAPPESEELQALRKAKEQKTPVEGRVFGYNNGGFHVVIGGLPAFCPRSEIKASQSIGDPESYVDQTFEFRVLKIQSRGKRIVISRSAIEREEQHERRAATMKTLEIGATVKGAVTSIADFGAFVDLGGVEGLVHISEISRQRVQSPSEVLEMGQEVEVKVLKIEKGGKRISLSIKALLPDPWRDIKERFEEGSIVTGRVERTGRPGAFIELEPGLTGLLPTSEMSLPRDAIPGRLYPPGREVKVQIVQVDTRRRRISLAPEGAALGGSRTDYMNYVKGQKVEESQGLSAMAAAFSKFKK